MNSLEKLGIYSDSDNEEKEKEEDRFPLPDFLRMSNSSIGNPQHLEVNAEGKIRNFPHVPGNWATYLYIPVDPTEFNPYLIALLNIFKPLDLKPVDDFHISLTKTVVLRHHWISDFIASIKSNLTDTNSLKIHLCGLKAYTNEQKTRSFLSIKVDEGENDLKVIVAQLNKCFKDYNLEEFYEHPSFHMSLLWCPGDRITEINKYIDLIPSKVKNFGFFKEVYYCICATGNKRFNFYF